MELEFFDTPQPFLDVAAPLLAADPVLGSVIASVTERTAREVAAGEDSWTPVGAPFERWWVVVRDASGEVVSAAMRTAPPVSICASRASQLAPASVPSTQPASPSRARTTRKRNASRRRPSRCRCRRR